MALGMMDGIHLPTLPLRVAPMARDVFAKHPIHQGLLAVARGLEVVDDFRAVAHGYEQLLVLGLWPAAQVSQRDHGLQMFRCERLCIGVIAGGCRDDLVLFHRGYEYIRAFRGSRHSVSPRDDWHGAG